MAPAKRPETAFPDLVMDLMQHTWLVLVYAVLCVSSIYVLGRFASDVLIFSAIQLPAVAAVSAATFSTELAFPRIPVTWLATAVLALAFLADPVEYDWAPTGFAIAAASLIAYGILRAVLGTLREYRQRRDELGLSGTVAVLIASWGATLQVGILALLWIRGDVRDLLLASEWGRRLVHGLQLLTLTSPTAWFPAGLLLFGVALLAALRFQDEPYRPWDFEDVMPTRSTGMGAALLTALRLPTWIVTIIIGFLVHFVRLAWLSLRFFLRDWLGRLVLLLFAVVLPVVGLIVGHWCYWKVALTVAEYLNETRHAPLATVAAFLAIHAFALAALSVYAISAGPLIMHIRPTTPREAFRSVLEYASQDTLLALNAVGRVFSLFGILFIALPLAAAIPGPPGFGPFATVYSILVGLLLAYVFVLEAGGRKEA